MTGHITCGASNRTIGRAVDCGISRNLTRCVLQPGSAIPGRNSNAWTDPASPMPATAKNHIQLRRGMRSTRK